MEPSLAGFLAFVRTTMNINTKILPDNSPFITLALAVALAVVNPDLAGVALPATDAAGVTISSGTQTVYVIAVYNLAADNLINFAIDQPGFRYFQNLRKKLNVNGFVSGVVQSSADESTSVSVVVQDAAKNFTLANLQNLKTPYGRAYLALAQSFGPTTWGLT